MSASRASAVGSFPSAQVSAGHYHSHVVQFYAEDSFLVDAISRFVGTALGAGDAAVIIATQAHRDGVAERLQSRGLDLNASARHGRYTALDARETLSKFMVDGFPDLNRFSNLTGPLIEKARTVTESGNGQVVAFGEMVALLWEEQQIEAAMRLEQLWNELAKTHSFSLRCAYPITQFHRLEDGAPLLRICAEHSNVIPAENYSELGTDDDRLRDVARLQQKEQAHDALRKAKDQLETEISERREIERKLLNSEHSLRELSTHILRMQDEERRRIGADLHDSVGQYLSVLKMHLDALAGDERDTNVASHLADCINLVEESIREVRTMAYLLHPPMLEEMGLKSAVPWYLDGFTKRSGIRTSFEISPGLGRLPRETELTIFRVVQESLTNVHRHSGSGTAQVVVLLQGGSVRLEVRDKGKGFSQDTMDDFARGSRRCVTLGLRGMSERVRQLGGTLQTFSGEGATIVATIPIAEDNAPGEQRPTQVSASEYEVIYPD